MRLIVGWGFKLQGKDAKRRQRKGSTCSYYSSIIQQEGCTISLTCQTIVAEHDTVCRNIATISGKPDLLEFKPFRRVCDGSSIPTSATSSPPSSPSCSAMASHVRSKRKRFSRSAQRKEQG